MGTQVKKLFKIYSLDDLVDNKIAPLEFKIHFCDLTDFQLNKFFIKIL